MQIFTLYFGRSVRDRAPVSDQEWRELPQPGDTPALPDGYTVLDGQGAWMSPRTHVTIAEATKVLVVAMPEQPATSLSSTASAAIGQHRFHHTWSR